MRERGGVLILFCCVVDAMVVVAVASVAAVFFAAAAADFFCKSCWAFASTVAAAVELKKKAARNRFNNCDFDPKWRFLCSQI